MSEVVIREIPDDEYERRFDAIVCLVLDAVRMSLSVALSLPDGSHTDGLDAREAVCNLINAAVLIATAVGHPEEAIHLVVRETFARNAECRDRWRSLLDEAIAKAAGEVAKAGGASEAKAKA